MRKAFWSLSTLAVCMLPVAARGQWPGSGNPWAGPLGIPPMPGGIGHSGPLGMPRLGNNVPGSIHSLSPTCRIYGPGGSDVFNPMRSGDFSPHPAASAPTFNPVTVPQIAPDLGKLVIPPYYIPKPFTVSPPREKSFHVPSWVRWEWAAGIFGASLVAGFFHGYITGEKVSPLRS